MKYPLAKGIFLTSVLTLARIAFQGAVFRSVALAFLLGCGLLPRLVAQAAVASQNPVAAREDVLALSPFEVTESNEGKWQAASTLLGNRTNQELIKVPVTVDVLTADFMRDVGLFNFDDAGGFISGVTSVPRLESRNDNGRLTFRGLNGAGTTSRNFFQWSVPSDTY